MTGEPGVTVRVKVALPVPLALVALIVTLEVPAVVGVPEIVAPASESPAGKGVAVNVIGVVPVAVMV